MVIMITYSHINSNMMPLTLSELECKRQQGLFSGKELWKILPCDDHSEHFLHSGIGSAGHWPSDGMHSRI